MRVCTKCKTEKPFSEFYARKGGRDGIRSECKECDKARAKEWIQAHPDEVRAYKSSPAYRDYMARYRAERGNALSKANYLANHEARLETKRKYYQEHRQEHRANAKRWVASNPERARDIALAAKGRRRARERNAPAETVLRSQIIARDGGRCHFCGKKCKSNEIELDHLIPVAWSDKVSEFEHSSRNVAVACRACNRKNGSGRMPAQLRLVG